jgi:hypothetical protein
VANVHHVISLGIGSPADIPHFILFGLSPTGAVAVIAATADMVIQVRSDSTRITVRRDVGTIQVRPDVGDIEL